MIETFINKKIQTIQIIYSNSTLQNLKWIKLNKKQDR